LGSGSVQRLGGSLNSLTGIVAGILLVIVLAREASLWIGHVSCERAWDDGAVQLARDVHYNAQGGPIYTDFRRPPYVAQEYDPAIPFFARRLTRIFGSDVFACLRIGRWLTIAGTFAACIAMVLLARRFSSFQAAAIAAVAFALTPVFFPWFSEFRVDMPALFLELMGLYAFSLGADLAALFILLAAFLTKQTYVAGIVSVVVLSWWRGDRRRAVKLAAGWAIVVAIAVSLIQWRNPFFLLNTMAAHVPLWDWSAPPDLLGRILLSMLPLVALAVVGVRRKARAMELELAYAIVAALLCGFFALRWGSDFNYFLELAAAIAVIAAGGIDVVLAAGTAAPGIWQAGIGVALAAVLMCPALVGGKLAVGHLLRLDFRFPAQSCDPGWNPEAFRILAKTDGPILTQLPDISLRLPRVVWAPEFDVLRSMRREGLFDDSELVAMVSQKKISAIVLGREGLNGEYRGRPFFWPRLRLAIEQNYVPVPAENPPYLMVPSR
jgi:hypothetical protein